MDAKELTDDALMTAIKSVCDFDAERAEKWRPEALAIGRAVERAVLAALPSDAAQAPMVPQAVLDALRFYARGQHYNIDADQQQFDTVSGEPQNWLFSERDDDCTMIEDGSIAKAALCGCAQGFEEPPEPLEGEVLYAAPVAPAAAALSEAQIDAIMEQAQVFASAWSLVGGVFDSGGALETAEQEKANLRSLLAGTIASQAKFECAARKQGSVGGNDPADCDWPVCGCDEHANKVIESLEESGALKHTPIYQIGAPGIAGHQVVWWDVPQEEYERQKKAGYMKTGIVYREPSCS